MKAIAYFRISTDRQGKSGLGLAAQQEAIQRHIGPDAEVVAEYREIESGRKDSRPELAKALDHCRRTGATLVVAKLDRLARSAHFLLTILNSGIDVQFADLPQVSGPQGKFLLTSMAAVAELEAGLISERTRAALAAAKARGQRLGNPDGGRALAAYVKVNGNAAAVAGKKQAADDRAEAWRSTLKAMIGEGMSNNAIAKALNAKGETTVRGGSWTATAVRRLRERLGLNADATAYRQAA